MRWIVTGLLLLGLLLGGAAHAEPTSDRLCVFAGFTPIVFVEECVDIPGWPTVPQLPITPQ